MVNRTTETDWKSLYEAETRVSAKQAAEIVQLREQPSVITEQSMTWQPIETAPKDGSEILILTSIGVTQARFSPGEWHDYQEGREYDGPVWVCCDDQWQIEIEDCGKDGVHHGIATHWMSLPAPPTGQP